MRLNGCVRMGREMVSGRESVLDREMVPDGGSMFDREMVSGGGSMFDRESMFDCRMMGDRGGACGEELSILQWRCGSVERRVELPP